MVKIPEGLRPPDMSPEDVRTMNLRFIQRWQGEHDPARPDMVGVNTRGSRPPLFWVFQGENEFRALGSSLHRDQPLYGMKSVVYSSEKEDLHQIWFLLEPGFLEPATAHLRQQIVDTAAGRPFVLGGNCAGSVMALHLARSLPVRPARLILMNLLRDAGPYDGRVEMLFGSEEAADFDTFDLGAAAFPDHACHILRGRHGNYIVKPAVWEVARLVDGVLSDVS